jgi:hypothetical protein
LYSLFNVLGPMAKGFYISPKNAANNTTKKNNFVFMAIVYWLYASIGAGFQGF